MILADLSPSLRRHKVHEALEAALRQIGEPTSTSDLVKRIAVILGTPRETITIARLIGALAPNHPNAYETGETFQKYGQAMRRKEWLPSHTKHSSKSRVTLDPEELERRRAIIALHAVEEWEVPAEPEFLEED